MMLLRDKNKQLLAKNKKTVEGFARKRGFLGWRQAGECKYKRIIRRPIGDHQ